MVHDDVTGILAEYLSRTQFEDLTGEAIRSTKIHILHTLGTVIAGSSAAGINQVLAAVSQWGTKEESAVLVCGVKLPAPSAALVNSTMAHSRELDINDDRIAYKTSVAAIPAALATAERRGHVSGKELITAVCLGVDLGIRIGLATNPKPTHVLFNALGPFAAAAASARILGLDEVGMRNALGIAYCRVTFSGNRSVSPSLTKRLGAGFASHSGVIAALLAAEGFPAAGEIFSGPTGYFQTYYKEEGDLDTLLDGPGRRYEIVSVGPKPFPSCRYTHPAVTGVMSLLRDHPITVEEIAEVRVRVGERDMHAVWGREEMERKKRYRPEGIVDAQFSIPYTVAVTLLRGKLTLDDFTDEAISNEAVLSLAERVKPVLDPLLEQWPLDVKPQVVEIVTRDGTVYSQRVEYPKGSPSDPVTLDELQENFREMARFSARPLRREKIEQALSVVSRLEEIEDATIVSGLLS
jgi:2-methylcitrate dehydratase PrpD